MKAIRAAFLAAAIAAISASPASAHCDTLDGPVVGAARSALATANVDNALIWVNKDHEAELSAAFKEALAVRKLNAAAREMADRNFYETVVRLHRLGEGASYDGLKPSGTDLGPAIPAADKAITSGSPDAISALLSEAVQAGLREKYQQVLAKRSFDKNNVAAGREYVEAYVQYLHYVERLYEAAHNPAHGHHAEAKTAEE